MDFGNISARDINMDQEGKLVRPFLVRLVGCASYGSENQSTPGAYATITFTGNASSQDPTVLIPDGEGRGLVYRFAIAVGSFNFWRTLLGISAK